MDDVCPALINDDRMLRRMLDLAEELLGRENAVRMNAPSLGADDFAFFSDQVPGCFFNIGTLGEVKDGQVLHSTVYAPEEGCIEVGITLMAGGVLELLQSM
jgi:metal-dependent amidase/aminoacylase/carboxypeptidase family protein